MLTRWQSIAIRSAIPAGAGMKAITWPVRFADRSPQDTKDVLSQLERDGLVESIAALRAG